MKLTAEEGYRLAEEVEELSRQHGLDLGFADILNLVTDIAEDRKV